MIESSVRNIWQAREIKQGLPAFQVGPTCYRGLWIVDGAFLLEAATILGAGDQARNGVAYELTTQKEDGRIQSLAHDFWKENVGFVLVFVTALRYIFLLQFTPIAYVQWAKVVVFVASIPGLLLGIGWMHEFQLYLEEGEILTLFPASLDGRAAGDHHHGAAVGLSQEEGLLRRQLPPRRHPHALLLTLLASTVADRRVRHSYTQMEE